MALPALPALAGILALTVGEIEIVRPPSDGPAATPAPRPCSSAEYRQFDFWLGEWDVAEKGKPAGVNRITAILGGCAVREEWKGASGLTGTSLNMWDSGKRRWTQTWVDDKGNVLLLLGRAPGTEDGPRGGHHRRQGRHREEPHLLVAAWRQGACGRSGRPRPTAARPGRRSSTGTTGRVGNSRSFAF